MARRKVFVIGFHKTGTTSLHVALETLGHRVCGPVGIHAPDPHAALSLVPEYDAFRDNPWPLLFRECDQRWPGSKFILTRREITAWTRSVVRHFGTRDTPMRELIYGVGHPFGNEDLYRDRHLRHVAEVRAWFRDRPDAFLEMDVSRGCGWMELCGFLGLEEPPEGTPFPHANSAQEREAQPAR